MINIEIISFMICPSLKALSVCLTTLNVLLKAEYCRVS
jgi:hypothetical protein